MASTTTAASCKRCDVVRCDANAIALLQLPATLHTRIRGDELLRPPASPFPARPRIMASPITPQPIKASVPSPRFICASPSSAQSSFLRQLAHPVDFAAHPLFGAGARGKIQQTVAPCVYPPRYVTDRHDVAACSDSRAGAPISVSTRSMRSPVLCSWSLPILIISPTCRCAWRSMAR